MPNLSPKTQLLFDNLLEAFLSEPCQCPDSLQQAFKGYEKASYGEEKCRAALTICETYPDLSSSQHWALPTPLFFFANSALMIVYKLYKNNLFKGEQALNYFSVVTSANDIERALMVLPLLQDLNIISPITLKAALNQNDELFNFLKGKHLKSLLHGPEGEKRFLSILNINDFDALRRLTHLLYQNWDILVDSHLPVDFTSSDFSDSVLSSHTVLQRYFDLFLKHESIFISHEALNQYLEHITSNPPKSVQIPLKPTISLDTFAEMIAICELEKKTTDEKVDAMIKFLELHYPKTHHIESPKHVELYSEAEQKIKNVMLTDILKCCEALIQTYKTAKFLKRVEIANIFNALTHPKEVKDFFCIRYLQKPWFYIACKNELGIQGHENEASFRHQLKQFEKKHLPHFPPLLPTAEGIDFYGQEFLNHFNDLKFEIDMNILCDEKQHQSLAASFSEFGLFSAKSIFETKPASKCSFN